MNTKKVLTLVTVVCGITAAGLIALPNVVADSVPTATIVNVEKVEHTDCVSLSGTVTKNLRENTFSVQVYVPEQDISKVALGQIAEITGDAFPGVTYLGEVSKISDIATKVQLGTVQKTAVEVTVNINEPEESLKQGYTAQVKLITSEPDIMTIVPYDAVDQDDTGEFVYILTDGRAYKRYIETGEELSDGVELKTVLDENERIITVDELSESGVPVKLSGK
ncbi:MAG: HlyD family efflux transporter periplasmic adaptor subunit [Oscillospiraceae bacterium]|nr:HlyD family efflux transporter periplasmic adaptor subunit [Oscillospiraceae bacterium]